MTTNSHLSSRSRSPGRWCCRLEAPVLTFLFTLALVGLASGCRRQGTEVAPARSEAAAPTHGRLVALVVLDTVRRDYVEPCGDNRPITPNLAKLARGGTTYCGMVAPGSWTLPVHASMFTGLLPLEHGADSYSQGVEVPGLKNIPFRPLDKSYNTLAERFKAAGYQTVLVSGNPVLHPASGLAQGFDEVVVSEFAVGNYALVHRRVLDILQSPKIDPRRPLFLFVNIIIAHNPYERVPEGVDWLPATPHLIEFNQVIDGETLLYRFYHDELGFSEDGFLQDLRANYAWGVHRADEDLGKVMKHLKDLGWLRDNSVIVVTSDHGERLGENRTVGHGTTVAKSVTHVFAVVKAPGFRTGVRLNGLTQNQDIYPTLLKAGGLPYSSVDDEAIALDRVDTGRIAVTTSQPDRFRMKLTGGVEGDALEVALETSKGRLTWSSQKGFKNENLHPSEAERLREPALKFAREAKNAVERSKPAGLPPDLEKQLKALGYVN